MRKKCFTQTINTPIKALFYQNLREQGCPFNHFGKPIEERENARSCMYKRNHLILPKNICCHERRSNFYGNSDNLARKSMIDYGQQRRRLNAKWTSMNTSKHAHPNLSLGISGEVKQEVKRFNISRNHWTIYNTTATRNGLTNHEKFKSFHPDSATR